MNTKTLLISTIALTLIGSAIAPQPAKADIPMTITPETGGWTLTVPDDDTTVSAYGGRLRHYDVHIAKMIEVTRPGCKQTPRHYTKRWKYLAGNGSIDMGTFVISCGLTFDLFEAYGTGKSEETEFVGLGTSLMPTLNITGGKVDKWIRFTNNFKPVR
jgi:hypothetical protein